MESQEEAPPSYYSLVSPYQNIYLIPINTHQAAHAYALDVSDRETESDENITKIPVGESVFTNPKTTKPSLKNSRKGQKTRNTTAENECSEEVKTGKISWVDFAKRTTLHGFKIFHFRDQDGRLYKIRRAILLLAVLTSTCLFLYHSIQRYLYYAGYPTNVDVKVIYNNSLEFPSVTICNQNQFRLSSVVNSDTYEFVMKHLKDTTLNNGNANNLALMQKIVDENYTKFAYNVSHQRDDLIQSCTWSSEPCQIDEDFKSTFTDLFTLCYTFNWNASNVKKVYQPGARYSLQLILNVENYEYVQKLQGDIGVKILIHPQNESPLMNELGNSVPPGTHTLIGITPTITESLPSPHGFCINQALPRANCMAKAKFKKLAEKCGCKGLDVLEFGNLEDSLPAENVINDLMDECLVPCYRTSYVEEVSFAKLAKLDLERFRVNNPDIYNSLRSKFKVAKQAEDSVKDYAASTEKMLALEIIQLATNYESNLKRMFLFFQTVDDGDINICMNHDDDCINTVNDSSDKIFNNASDSNDKIVNSHADNYKNYTTTAVTLSKTSNTIFVDSHQLKNLTEPQIASTFHDILLNGLQFWDDFKLLNDEYKRKLQFVMRNIPYLHQFNNFVKLLCAFTEKPYPVQFKFVDSHRPNYVQTFLSDDSTESESKPTIKQLLELCSTKESNISKFDIQPKDNNNNDVIDENVNSEDARDRDVKYGSRSNIGKADGDDESEWDEFYSCDDQDIETFLGLRKTQLNNSLKIKDKVLKNVGGIKQDRMEVAREVLSGTSWSSYLNSEDEMRCLDDLFFYARWEFVTNQVYIGPINAYLHPFSSWTNKLQNFNSISYFLLRLETDNSSLYNRHNFEECRWPFLDSQTPTKKQKEIPLDKHYAMFEAYMKASESSILELDAAKTLGQFSLKINETIKGFKKHYAVIYEKIEKFLVANMTKKMFSNFLTLPENGSIGLLESMQEDYMNFVGDFDQLYQKTLNLHNNMNQTYYHLINIAVPVLSDAILDQMYLLNYTRFLAGSNRTGFASSSLKKTLEDLLKKLKKNREQNTMNLLNALYDDYKKTTFAHFMNVDESFKKFMKAVEELKQTFLTTSVDHDLDENFFRDNMIKIDVYFKEIKYKKIQQKPALTGLVLFSEVGSVMNLLLGTSILTFCELFDFIFSFLKRKVTKKWHKN
ncbi:hypothetical protein HELRODRAFT_171945 [Helobdella robusta]|uniref:Uncharacterized protein n=1 Tax=Helobdella robusta TaxID=6412 RepID=T1F4V7_HELRO|nr:hypothetical protein HELRODRAFT_171945 [Helobdella robusta]ESO04940.1 hypothetical protein HELRODRAFT_171945 [Helobdella robusta]